MTKAEQIEIQSILKEVKAIRTKVDKQEETGQVYAELWHDLTDLIYEIEGIEERCHE